MAKQRRIKIISDGSDYSANVVDAETGETIRYVQSVDVHVDGEHRQITGTMVVFQPETAIVANVEVNPDAFLQETVQQILEAWHILEKLADPDADIEDAPRVEAQEWLERWKEKGIQPQKDEANDGTPA